MMRSNSPDVLAQKDNNKQSASSSATSSPDVEAFSAGGWNEAKRYTVQEVIGKGSYGIVCSALDNATGQMVAIKKIQNVFENVADAVRILREIKLLRLLKHPDVVEIKHILLPSDPRAFRDLYVVFELFESDLHTVIAANDDLTHDHHKVFLYQLLRGLNFMHQCGVLHRDLKPKNILANSNCKLKICDFGLARPYTNQEPMSPVFWTDYVATRWYRAPELCGCFYGRYTQAVDVWSCGCIFAEVLLRGPLFPGRDAVSQLQVITDLLGKPPQHVIDGISNQRARAFLNAMPAKPGRPFEVKFPGVDPLCLDLLRAMLSFDPAERPTAAEALAHDYFQGLPSAVHQDAVGVSAHFEFEQHKLSEADVRQLIYQEVLHYHPQAQNAYRLQQQAQAAAAHQRSSPYVGAAAMPVDDVQLQFMLAEKYGASAGGDERAAPAMGLPSARASVAAMFSGMTTWQRTQAEALLHEALQQLQAQQQAQAAAAAQQQQQQLHHAAHHAPPGFSGSGGDAAPYCDPAGLAQYKKQLLAQHTAAMAEGGMCMGMAMHRVSSHHALPICATGC